MTTILQSVTGITRGDNFSRFLCNFRVVADTLPGYW